ncbi:hypothetical protein [uncultured Flavobacterium sp.]|uniref:hypothetical protein n=1 Tax=uncultured Flavobacterium sp. TaxID=165435 RepID=UPI0030CA53E4|tara:strand:- start:611 stop:1321 length:711 start_codon:yes stop_codon:yes gene_type:complete
MKKIVILSMVLFSMFSYAQENYKVVIMSKKFDFLKKDNQYNLNTMCKLFFEKEGFTVYYDSEVLPNEIANNRCNALILNLVENNSMFSTKIKVELKDCQNNIIIASELFETREKVYDIAYNQVTRLALKSLEGFTKVKNLYLISQVNPIRKVEDKPALTNKEPSINLLSVWSTKNGYRLVNKHEKIIYQLFKTSNPIVFIAFKDDIQGVFTLNAKKSTFESYLNDILVVEAVEVEF